MKNTAVLFGAALVLAAACWAAPAGAAEEAATWSFSAGEGGTVASAVSTTGGKIAVDLSALPKGAAVFRAVLRMSRDQGPGWKREGDTAVVAPADQPDKPLSLLAPRFTSFDATEAVAKAVKDGAGKVELAVKSLSGWKQLTTRLDVSFTGGKAKNELPKVTGVEAWHKSGQTLLPWKDSQPIFTAPELAFKEYNDLRAQVAKQAKPIAFRIYRAAEPITAGNIAKAELVDEVGQFTCWDPDYYGVYPGGQAKLPHAACENCGYVNPKLTLKLGKESS